VAYLILKTEEKIPGKITTHLRRYIMNSKLSKKIGTGVVIALLVIFISVNAFGNDSSPQKSGRRHHGPPPEAYTACEGKNAGDTAEFISPRGDTVTGIWVQESDRLVLRPDKPPRGNSDGKEMNDTDN
jgi:hypothetical protein